MEDRYITSLSMEEMIRCFKFLFALNFFQATSIMPLAHFLKRLFEDVLLIMKLQVSPKLSSDIYLLNLID